LPIVFHMEPTRPPMNWEAFKTQMPRRSIAVDGFVNAPPCYDLQSQHFNFDHHAGPPRPAMLSSAMQVRSWIHDGLLTLLMPTGDEEVHVWMNDCDPDVALCYYAFVHHFIVAPMVNPALNRLFGHVDTMDKRAGLVDLPRDMEIVRQAAWIFQPYWDFRMSGALDRKDPGEHMGVLESIAGRIDDFASARGKSVSIEDDYETLHRGAGWEMVREIGPHARMKLARRQVRAFASVRQTPSGRWYYTLCRYAPVTYWFPVPEIGRRLSEQEPEAAFGGGDTVMGNARGPGSTRGPEEMAQAIDQILILLKVSPP